MEDVAVREPFQGNGKRRLLFPRICYEGMERKGLATRRGVGWREGVCSDLLFKQSNKGVCVEAEGKKSVEKEVCYRGENEARFWVWGQGKDSRG